MKNTKLEKGFKSKMRKTSSMNKSSKKGVLLATIILFSISLVLTPLNGYAEEINVKSVGVDKTTIITFTNDASEEVKTFRIWLSQSVNFESFKTEKGWVGEKTPQGVIIFTASEPIKKNESVKFGIKTDKSNPTVNWKGVDQTNSVIDTGVIMTTKMKVFNQNPEINVNQNVLNSGEILSESTFKIIPKKPNTGSTIRVTGDHFGASQVFDFYINEEMIGNFETDQNGFFITTMKIPDVQTNERIDFKIKDKNGQVKTVSLRVGDNENRILESKNMRLSIGDISNIIYVGENFNISGTASPGNAISLKIINSEERVTNTRIVEVDNKGNWELPNPINIPFDAPFGKYSIVISDGRNQVLKNWNVETNKVIIINPTKIKFDAGELIKFSGTALPEIPLELILEDSLGNEIMSEIINVDKSGFLKFEYQSKENDDIEGTWTLIATQKENKEFTYVGYDVTPTIPVNIVFNDQNYKINETAVITLVGKPSDNVKLIIVSPSGSILGKEIPIQLREDGRIDYELTLDGYVIGIYTAVIQKGNTQSSEKFSVGLSLSTGKIEVQSTQTEYRGGEKILLLGKTTADSLMIATLIDPNGNEIRSLEVPSNHEGVFTEDRLRIPINAIVGIWKINVSSGGNSSTVEFEVYSAVTSGISVKVDEGIIIPGFGENIKIAITSDHKTSITIQILDQQQNVIDKTLTCNTTTEFKCEVIWTITKEIPPGTYIVRVNDSLNSAETTFAVK